jgi:hypothetical protein
LLFVWGFRSRATGSIGAITVLLDQVIYDTLLTEVRKFKQITV